MTRMCRLCGAILKDRDDQCWFCRRKLADKDIVVGKRDFSPRRPEIGPSSFLNIDTDLSPSALSEDRSSGVVYLLRAGQYWKIGKANNSSRRVQEIKLQLPFKAELVHEITTNDIDWLERHWHLHFHKKRKNGEWFLLDASDVAEFCEHDYFEVRRSTRSA